MRHSATVTMRAWHRDTSTSPLLINWKVTFQERHPRAFTRQPPPTQTYGMAIPIFPGAMNGHLETASKSIPRVTHDHLAHGGGPVTVIRHFYSPRNQTPKASRRKLSLSGGIWNGGVGGRRRRNSSGKTGKYFFFPQK